MGWLRVIVFLSYVVFALSQDTETPKRDTQTSNEYYDVFGDKIDVETILDMAPELNEEDGSEDEMAPELLIHQDRHEQSNTKLNYGDEDHKFESPPKGIKVVS